MSEPMIFESDKSGNKVITDPTERLHDKIRKILALTKSSSEGEAQIAATKLQALLLEHNLSVADLEQKGAAAPGVREESHDLGKAAFKWKLDLAEGIAEFYYCAPLVDRQTKTVAFVGRPDNVESLQALYKWVIEQVKQIATIARREHYDATGEHIDPLRWQVSFGEGAVERLIDRMKEMKARQQEDMARDQYGEVVALAVHHASEVSDYLEEKFGYRTDGKLTKEQKEREERWKAYERKQAEEEAARIQLKAKCEASGDMEPYYQLCPWDRPEEVERRRLEAEKTAKEEERRERRNAKRRTGGWGSYRGKSVDWEKESQSSKARQSGRANADKVNLQPFLGTGGAKPGAKKVRG